MKLHSKLHTETPKNPTHDFEYIKARVLKMEIKPFATDHIRVGDWCIAANACGYFLSIDGDYRFSFLVNEVDKMLGIIFGINAGILDIASCRSSADGILFQGQFLRCKVKSTISDFDFFEQALASHNLTVECYGRLTWRTDSCHVAVVSAGGDCR